jgi:translation initiation factor IF-1
MAHANQIQAPGKLIEVLAHEAYRAELANGHRCIVRAPRGSVFSVGDEVTLEFHPYDLSRGWIVVPA